MFLLYLAPTSQFKSLLYLAPTITPTHLINPPQGTIRVTLLMVRVGVEGKETIRGEGLEEEESGDVLAHVGQSLVRPVGEKNLTTGPTSAEL